MKGSLRRRGARGLWVVDLRVPDPAMRGGWRTVRISTHTADRAEAEAIYRREIARYELGGNRPAPAAGRKRTVEEWIQSWIEAKRASGRRESTVRQYANKARLYIYPALGHVALADVSPEAVRLWVVALAKTPKAGNDRAGNLSPRTVQLAYTILSAALAAAVREGLILRNPCQAVDRPHAPEYDARPLTLEEAEALLRAAQGTRLEAMWILALHTGMRPGELLALRWQDVDMEAKRIRIPDAKTASGIRTLALADPVVAALASHRARQDRERLERGPRWQECGLVFPSTVGTPYLPQNLSRKGGPWPRLLERAGLPPTRRHDLRHTAGTFALELAGAPPKAVQEMLGHASEAFFLRRYAHALPGSRERTAQAMADLLTPGAGTRPTRRLRLVGRR